MIGKHQVIYGIIGLLWLATAAGLGFLTVQAQRANENYRLLLDAADQQAQQLRDSVKSKEAELADLQAERAKTGETTAALREKFAALTSAIDEQKKLSARLESDLAQARRSLFADGELRKTVEESRMNVARLSATIADERARHMKLEREYQFNIGVACAQAGKYEDAAEAFSQVLMSDPTDADAHYNLAFLYREHLHDDAKALYHVGEYLRAAGKTADPKATALQARLLADETKEP